MTHAAFIDVVRQLAAATLRKKLSFASVVHAWAAVRVASITLEVLDPAQRANAVADLQAFLNREYAVNDPKFTTQQYD